LGLPNLTFESWWLPCWPRSCACRRSPDDGARAIAIKAFLDLHRLGGYLKYMKEISIKIDDELYRRASRKVENLEADVNQHVTEYLQALNGDDDDDDAILDARSRMSELFSTTRNFGVGVKPTRDEMHERGSIH
jgi:hypothetical protein